MTNIYKDPIIQKYFDLIKSKLGDGAFKQYYQGDPIVLPGKSLMPCLILAKAETRVGPLTNSDDEHSQRLLLTVVTDVRDEINDDDAITPGTAALYDIMEGRESDTLKLKTTSLLHIIRNNILVDAALNLRTDLASVTRVDYGMTVGKRAKDAWAVEGQIEFVCNFNQVR